MPARGLVEVSVTPLRSPRPEVLVRVSLTYAVMCSGIKVTVEGTLLKGPAFATRIWAAASGDLAVGVCVEGTVILATWPLPTLEKLEAGLSREKEDAAAALVKLKDALNFAVLRSEDTVMPEVFLSENELGNTITWSEDCQRTG